MTEAIIGENDAIKRNALEIADHHRRTCEGEDCVISLILLLRLLELAGISLTPEERRRFII